MDEDIRTIKFAWRWIISILGMIGTAMAIASMAKRGFSIDLLGAPSIIYEGYASYRNFVFSLIHLDWPNWVKDILVVYVALGMAFHRGAESTARGGIEWDWFDTFILALMLCIWPYVFFRIAKDSREEGTQIMRVLILTSITILAAVVAFFWWSHMSK